MTDYAYFDIETLDRFEDARIKRLPRDQQLQAMRFGCAVVRVGAERHEYLHDGDQGVAALYTWMMTSGHTAVGWGILGFDWFVICHGVGKPFAPTPALLDLRQVVIDATNTKRYGSTRKGKRGGRWYGLDVIAQENLGRGKTGSGADAPLWLRSGDPAQVRRALDYCNEDVQLVQDLHAILLRGEALLLPCRPDRHERGNLWCWVAADGTARVEVAG